MPISLQCPKCGKGYQLHDEMVGKQAKCKCGKVFKVPAPMAERSEYGSHDGSRDERTQPPSPTPTDAVPPLQTVSPQSPAASRSEKPRQNKEQLERLRVKVGLVSMVYGTVMAVVFLGIELHEVFQAGFGLLTVLLPWWLIRPCLAGGIAVGGVLILRGSKRGPEYAGLCSGLLCLFPFWNLFALGPSTLMECGLGYYLRELMLSVVIYSIPLCVTIWCWKQRSTQDA